MAQALIIVDVQHDFCPGGALATDQGDEVAHRIGELQLSPAVADYDYVVTTQDWHIDPDDHFDTWPVHCEADSPGAQLHPAIQQDKISARFYKGQHSAAYSGFEGSNEAGQLLAEWLRDRGVSHLDICGIATDYCVRATVLDALKEGFQVRVLRDLCSAVNEDTGKTALQEMQKAGASLG
ncbi:isochorismatase family protein [Corynebacterium sp. 3HC-13]|uniref:isochorismatase family protein n=1 Tax=Corynebacterium poyangense TaxID=2684405 RepID=UPI001CCF1B6E|nr:isochorismatase family protein [Corynebacterium poyangense]MBZ8178237.1 isochorismatase family protein [Corynebacterium poyangense]